MNLHRAMQHSNPKAFIDPSTAETEASTRNVSRPSETTVGAWANCSTTRLRPSVGACCWGGWELLDWQEQAEVPSSHPQQDLANARRVLWQQERVLVQQLGADWQQQAFG